ncbi:MAG: DUF6586 family protein [Cellvibrionaceae bacterium]
MANYRYAAIVNQKLAFARVELAAASSHKGDSTQARLTQHAHLDSAIAQLCAALSYFVVEVAEQYGVELAPVSRDLEVVLSEFVGSGRQSAEISELRGLLKNNNAWLANLIKARQDPLLLVQYFKPRADGVQTDDGLVPLVDVTRIAATQVDSDHTSAEPANPLALVEDWARNAQVLVDRLRSSLHEE